MVGRHGEGNLSVGDAWSPSGFFTAASFPMSELQSDGVHFFDIVDHPGDIDFLALSTAYKVACEKKGLQPRNPLASRTNCQKTQWSKWCFWSSLTKRSPFSSTYPSLKRSRCRCWRNWSMEALSSFNSCQQTWKKCSTAWKTWEAALSHASTSDPKGSSKLNVAILNRKTTRRLIRDLIISFAKPNDPRVKWLNWNGRRRSCATRTLPSLVGLRALVSQALRSVVSENALARKGAHALACSFDSRVLRHFCPQSSWQDLGLRPVRPYPLAKALLADRCLWHRPHTTKPDSIWMGSPVNRCTPELDFLAESQAVH